MGRGRCAMSVKFQYSIPEMTKRLFGIAAPAKKNFLFSTLASIIGNLAQMGLMGFGALWVLSCAQKLPASAPPAAVFAVGMAVSGLLIVICRYIEGIASHTGSYSLLAHMRVHLFETIRKLAPACLADYQKGDLLSIAVADIETIEFFFAHTIGPMFTVILLPCISLALAFHYNPLFAAALLPVYLIISIVLPLAAIRAGRPVGLRYRDRLGELKSLVLESVYGIKDIQIFGHGPQRLQKVLEQNQRVNRAAHGLTLHQQAVSSAPTFFVYLARILIVAVASWLAAGGAQNPVGTVVISFVATASFSSTQSLTTVISSLLETYAAAERLFLIEDAVPQVVEPENPQPIGPVSEIRFEQVRFRYPGAPSYALDGFDLHIRAGETVGIVGESGIGKSTILRLLLRFWDPAAGKICINGVSLRDVSLSELYGRIAVLEQDTFLFDASIAENIALGRPQASMEEIIRAARQAGVHDFISALPDGYQTQMGQMGARLSGGERQRIGIARVMLQDPEVLVMDEPTSSLDALHEKELLATLHRYYTDKTVLIVSHRMSTLAGCDRVIRLEGGKAVPVSHTGGEGIQR